MNEIPFADFGRAFAKHRADYEKASQSCLESGIYINGPEVGDFALALGKELDSPHVLPCANGTDALYLALKALALPAGSEVLVPAFGFVSAAEAVVNAGLVPVFYPVDTQTYTVDAEQMAEWALPSSCSALVVVHLFGLMADMPPIMDWAAARGLKVIEDNAQSLGAKHQNGKMAGTMGHIGTSSFFPTKNLGGFGDGGVLFTDVEEYYEAAKAISKHGSIKKYQYQAIGINSRLDTLQAALLGEKIKYFRWELDQRRRWAAVYLEAFAGLLDCLPTDQSHSAHTYNCFTVQTAHRDGLQAYLKAKGIATMVYYPMLQPLTKAYEQYPRIGDLETNRRLCEKVLSFTVFPYLTELEVSQIVGVTKSYLQNQK